MLCMATIEEVEPILNACLQNAENLLASAKAVMAPGQYHIGYHLAALAMEEIGKAGLILTEALGPDPSEEDKESLRSKWMEDHERKLFWAIWLPSFGVETDWRIIFVNLAGSNPFLSATPAWMPLRRWRISCITSCTA